MNNGNGKMLNTVLIGVITAVLGSIMWYNYGYALPKLADAIIFNDRMRATEDFRITEKLEIKLDQAKAENAKSHDYIVGRQDDVIKSLSRIEAIVLENNRKLK